MERNRVRPIYVLMLAAVSSFGGQSLLTTSNYVQNTTVPNRAHSLPSRVEVYFHDWDSTAAGNVAHSQATGFRFYLYTSSGQLRIQMFSGFDNVLPNIPGEFNLSSLATKAIYIRAQRDPAAGVFELEAWDKDGNRVYYTTFQITSDRPSTATGTQVGAPSGAISTGFFRVYSTVVPMNSRPPVTADHANTLLDWKFDGDLSDSSGNGYTGTLSSGSASYVPTPYQVVIAKAKTLNAPSWSDWVSMRAGQQNCLDASASFSQADASSVVTYQWSETSRPAGAPPLIWDSTTVAQPCVTGAVFGDYKLQLVVTDAALNSVTAGLDVGAVATDDNGVVVNANPNVDKIFGPMIAFGKNPWGYMDERALKATTLRAAAYKSLGIDPAGWQTPQAGTISYIFGGRSYLGGTPDVSTYGGTKLCAAITSTTQTDITVCNAAQLDLSSFPTRIVIGTYTGEEEVRICSADGNVLHACPAGGNRGTGGTTAKTFSNGANVGQLKVVGTGTHFLSTVCSGQSYMLALHYTRADGSDGQITWPRFTGCESDTELYLLHKWDIPSLSGSLQTGKQYAWFPDVSGYAGAFGVNFYGEDLAHRALYYRSGWKPALDAANVMSDQYVTSPYLSGGDTGGIPLLYGGGVVGAVAAALLDSRVPWSSLRGYFNIGYTFAQNYHTGTQNCNSWDTRDSSYQEIFLALGAAFDPDPAQRAKWVSGMQWAYDRDITCKDGLGTGGIETNSWAHSFLFNTSQYPALTATDGSAVLTGANLPAGMCYGTAAGSATVTSGSAAVTGSGFVSGAKIAITGTRSGQPYTGFFQFTLTSGTQISLSGMWPGDSGPVTYVIDSDVGLISIGTASSDTRLSNNWSCTWNSATQITLNRPWVKPGGGSETVYLHHSNLSGHGQQPYMVGMKTLQMRVSSLVADNPTLASNYAALAPLAAQWVRDNGYDPVTQGLYYGRIYGACEPPLTPTGSLTYTNPGCSYGLADGSIRAARVLTAEGSNALNVLYENNPTAANKTWGDTAYGSIWGFAPYTSGGVYSDNYYVRDENSDAYLGAYKYTGFFFGMGMSHQWPAVRLGGVAPPDPVSVDVSFSLPTGATHVTVSVTAPSGAVTPKTCISSPCTVSLDRRQGDHWIQKTYLDANEAVIQQDAPYLQSASTILPSAWSVTLNGAKAGGRFVSH